MIAAVLLGTALPTTPVSIVLAMPLVPALLALGVAPMAAHNRFSVIRDPALAHGVLRLYA
jgi:TRAP-type uncharacterized transport system fused permease subunit